MRPVGGPDKSLSNLKLFVSNNALIPLFYDGQDRRTEPVAFKSHQEIKAQRKAGLLEGWYQENGRVFVLYRAIANSLDSLQAVAGSGFDSAWAKLQSGYAGPLVWQLKTDNSCVEA